MENLLTFVNDKLKAKFGDAIISSSQERDFPVFIVERSKIVDIIKYLKEDAELGFGFLTTMCGLHYPDNTGAEMGMMYQLHNMPKNLRIRLKIFFPISDVLVPTLTGVFPASNWMERQEYDFFGIVFKGHPNLKRILNVDDMDYFPMRKEYPLEDGTREDKSDKMFGR